MPLVRTLIITFSAILSTLLFRAKAEDRLTMEDLAACSTSDLISKGTSYFFSRNNPDSALICYSVAVERYNDGLKDSEKELIAQAMTNAGLICYERFNDYASALDHIRRALKISQEIENQALTSIILEHLGNIYALCAQLANSYEISSRSTDSFADSYFLARSSNNIPTACRCIISLSSLALERSNITSKMRLAFSDFDNFLKSDSIPDRQVFEEFSAIGKLAINGDYSSARQKLEVLYDHLNSTGSKTEYIPQLLASMIECDMKLGDYSRAIASADSLIELTKAKRYAYDEAMAYRLRGELNSLCGNPQKAKADSLRFFCLRDSLMGMNHLEIVSHLESVTDIREQNRELTYRQHLHEKQQIFFIMAVILLIATAIFSLILYNRHCRLKASYRQLYRKQQAEIQREDTARQQRNNRTSHPSVSPSALSESQRDDFRSRILAVMDNDESVFSSDFSLDRLAELTGIKQRSLSVAINEIFLKNFYELLNEYRVREACRRLTDFEKFGHLTIEAISQSVGYRSRTSLVNAFKKETGLTPSEYQKMARAQLRQTS